MFENKFCMVLNKPAGLSVQGGEGIRVSLDSILSENYTTRPLLVHRLDRDTSGIILVAKNRDAASLFSALFASRSSNGNRVKFPAALSIKKDAESSVLQEKTLTVIKQYLAVCSGIPAKKQGVIRLALDVRGQDRESETFYRLLLTGESLQEGPYGGINFSLIELGLGTGRMHQIRRHLAKINHPVLGDDKYGNFPLNKQLRKTLGLKNLLLHASRLVIPPLPDMLPEGLDISSPPPQHFLPFTGSLG